MRSASAGYIHPLRAQTHQSAIEILRFLQATNSLPPVLPLIEHVRAPAGDISYRTVMDSTRIRFGVSALLGFFFWRSPVTSILTYVSIIILMKFSALCRLQSSVMFFCVPRSLTVVYTKSNRFCHCSIGSILLFDRQLDAECFTDELTLNNPSGL